MLQTAKIQSYKISDLKPGDTIGIYIRRGEGGSSMGVGVSGIEKYYTEVLFYGTVYSSNYGSAYFIDTKKPIGIPLNDKDIVNVISKGSMDVLKEVMRNNAIKNGIFHIKYYVEQFAEMPVPVGTSVQIDHYDYASINNSIGIRNKRKVLLSNNLVYKSFNGSNAIVVEDTETGKTAITAIETIKFIV